MCRKIAFVRPNSQGIKFEDLDIKDLPYYSTAFYVGNKKIITAAHAFDTDSRECLSNDGVPLTGERIVIFVPGMFLKYDYKGNRFGYYYIKKSSIKKLKGYLGGKNYSCNDIQYDICSAEISRGRICEKVDVDTTKQSYISSLRIKCKYGKDKDGDTSASESEHDEDIDDINSPDYCRESNNMIDGDTSSSESEHNEGIDDINSPDYCRENNNMIDGDDTSSSESEHNEDIDYINSPDYYRETDDIMIDADIDDKLGHSRITLSSRYPRARYSALKKPDKIIGYGYCPPNFEGRMCELYVRTNIFPDYYQAEDGAPIGMSGGPWILQGNTAFGIQAASEFVNIGEKISCRSAYSPKITENITTALSLTLP